MSEQRFTHWWRVRKWLPNRHGQRCRIVSTGKLNSALVEFEDGYRVVTNRRFVRRLAAEKTERPRGVNRP